MAHILKKRTTKFITKTLRMRNHHYLPEISLCPRIQQNRIMRMWSKHWTMLWLRNQSLRQPNNPSSRHTTPQLRKKVKTKTAKTMMMLKSLLMTVARIMMMLKCLQTMTARIMMT